MTFPPTIQHFIGQKQVTDRFKVALEASWNDGTRLPHMLMVGPPGTGKTMLAHLAAKEMAVNLVERIGQILFHPQVLNGLLMEVDDNEIFFVDEIHELSTQSQTTLYRALDDRSIFLETQKDNTVKLPVADFTLMAATTDEYALLSPLRDRFKLVLPFTFYEPAELALIVLQHARMMDVTLEDGVAQGIATRSRGTPRLALRLLEGCHRYTRSLGGDCVTTEHFESTVELERLDEIGLTFDEQKYLQLLAEHPEKPQRLYGLSARLGIHSRTIQSVIEPFLLRIGFIERTEQGRTLTGRGLDHVSKQGCHINA